MAGLLKVLTLNLWNMSGPLAERMTEARRWFELLEPDVACFQELVAGDGDGTGRPGGAGGPHAGIWDGLGYELLLCPIVPFGDAGFFGNGIVTRLPIVSHEVVDLPGLDREENRKAQLCTLTMPGGADLVVANTHLNWRLDEGYVREAQVCELDRRVRRAQAETGRDSQPPIICGDFNADADSTEIRYLAGLATIEGVSTAYQDCWRAAGRGSGCTWDNRNPFASAAHEHGRRLDYIWSGLADMVSGRGRVLHARVVCDEPLTGRHSSDHYGMYAEVLT